MKSKKEICCDNTTIAYYSGLSGLEIKYIEYGINDYIYCITGSWNGKPQYHKVKIYYNTDIPYIKIHGYRIPLNECIRTEAL